jgi:hypothetical protein
MITKSKVFLLLPFFFLSTGLIRICASPPDPEVATADLISKDSLKSFMTVLVSDSLEGRETGRTGQKKAAHYIAGSFFRFGLEPIAPDGLQPHPLSAKANKDKNIIIGEKKMVYRKDFFCFSGSSDSSVFFNAVTLSEKEQTLLRDRRDSCLAFPIGKSLLDFSEQTGADGPFEASYVKSLEKALEHYRRGAVPPVAVLLLTDDSAARFDYLADSERLNGPIYRYIRSLPFRVYWVSLDEFLSSVGQRSLPHRKKSIRKAIFLPAIQDPAVLIGENIPFRLKGRVKPDEVVVVTAHYDHLGERNDTVYYGADDDASGTSAVLELARVFSAAAEGGHVPLRSILFMPVSGEEKGLLGSRYYSENPLIPLKHTVADVNIDMIGRIDPEHDSLGIRDYIYVIGSDKLSSDLHAINEEANKEHVGLLLDYRYNVPGEPNRFYFRSDHYNFARHGIPSIFYFNGKHADYHRPTDTMDKIDFDTMTKRTRLIFHTVWELANRPLRPVVDGKNDMESPPVKRGVNDLKKR